MAEQDQALIDPALHAEDESYRSSLDGIYPSQNQGRAGTGTGIGSGSTRLEDEAQGYGQAQSASGSGSTKKKRMSSAVDDDGRKKSRQSRE